MPEKFVKVMRWNVLDQQDGRQTRTVEREIPDAPAAGRLEKNIFSVIISQILDGRLAAPETDGPDVEGLGQPGPAADGCLNRRQNLGDEG